MATTRFIDHLLEGIHADRPAAGDVPQGTLYACSTHDLIYQSDGSSTWSTWATMGGGGGGGADAITGQTGGGGAQITGLQGSVDIVPASPSADDDEFDISDTDPLTGWTTFGTPTHDIDNTAKSMYRAALASNDNNIHGIYKANPSMPFTMTARLTSAALRAGDQSTGIFIAEAGLTGKLYMLGAWNNGSTSRNDLELWNSRTSFNSQPASVVGAPQPPLIFTIVARASNDVDFFYADGGGLARRTLGLAVNPGFTIGAVGIFITNQNGTYLIEAFWDWVRFT